MMHLPTIIMLWRPEMTKHNLFPTEHGLHFAAELDTLFLWKKVYEYVINL